MKKTLTISIIFLACFFALDKAHAATEFISIVDTGGASDSDYSTLSTWENAIGTNLTAPSTIVFSGVVTGTAPSDGASVTLYRSGSPVGVGATVVHTAKTETQILLKNVSDSGYAWAADDQWRVNDANYFQIDDVTHDQPQVTAKCRATTGAADTTYVIIDNWDTDATHYIKIWTDPAENYRHQGKWDVSKYRLEVGDTTGITVQENYTAVVGIQIAIQASSAGTSRYAIYNNNIGNNVTISHCILKQNGTNGQPRGIAITSTSTSQSPMNAYIYNNIIYNEKGATTGYGIVNWTYSGLVINMYVYNNTVYNSDGGLAISPTSAGTTNFIIKNNLSYNNTDNYSGTFSASSTNNLSGPSADSDISGQSNPQNGVTVTFADEYNNDFHLDSSDTGAKNHGTILYDSGDDANLYFTTDADNEARKDVAGSWDIGADENVAKIYRSVGPSASSALAAGGSSDSSYGNMEIKPTYLNVGSTANLTDYIATFWRPLPDNVGVGDALQYDADNTGGIDNIVFITKRIDSTHYSVRKSDGTAPDATTSLPNSGWGIYRSYISLDNAVGSTNGGTENTGINSGVRNFDNWTGHADLTTNNLQWNIACYASGTSPDTTAIQIAWPNTTVDNFVKIYTPTRTDEVGTSQRHSGKWDTSKYYLQITDSTAFDIRTDYFRIEGLQITVISPSAARTIVGIYSGISANNDFRISNSILKGHNDATYTEVGIAVGTSEVNAKIWNNIIYDVPNFGSTNNRGISFVGTTGYIYNNTIYGSCQGIRLAGGNVVAKNNIAQNTFSNGYALTAGTWDSTSTNNLSDHADAPGSNPQNSKTVSFVDTTNKDFHLGVGDTAARNIGADLSNDLYLPIQTDIDSSGSIDGKSCDAVYQDQCLTRPGLRQGSGVALWDIGADELITKIYRSVGVGTTAAIISGTSPAISLTISGNTGTFSTFPTSADFGVGDVIRYDSDNNGTVDSTAFISAIDSTAKTATLQNSTGGTAPQMAVADFDWKLYRAYTSLSSWESGTENTGIGVTYDSGDRDIASNSEQWNVACYANSGTQPDTTGVTISGWTTKPTNYIRIYTPTAANEVTNSQRHQGKWDEGKYYREITDSDSILIATNYFRVEGLQISVISTSANSTGIYSSAGLSADNEILIINNIIKGSISSGHTGYGIYLNDDDAKGKFFNNIIYDFTQTGSFAFGIYRGKIYAFNNTAINSRQGFYTNNNNAVVKNNISYLCTDGYNGTFNASSDYNISDIASDAPGSHSKNSTTVSFIDATNKDFHLLPTDTAAKDSGADLSKDLYLPIPLSGTDIDGQQKRSFGSLGSFASDAQTDIGADEAATAIYRSLAPSATSAIASGTGPANSMIISGTAVTFGTAPGDTVGVGDAIQYDSDNNGSIDSVAFITYRVDSTHYYAQDRTGGTPTSTSATDYDWSIFRAYTSLQNASGSISGGAENTGLADAIEHFDIDWSASHGKNIYTNNQQWNIAAYANSTTADTVQTLITSWTTYPTNYLKIYTPNATTEVGISQRHQGKWDTAKYYRTSSAGSSNIYNYTDFLRVDGLQIQLSSTTTSYTNGIYLYPLNPGAEIQLSNNIIRGVLTDSANNVFGIKPASVSSGIKTLKLWNNILYDFINGTNSSIEAIQLVSGYNTYLYNNTVYNSYYGYHRNGGTVYAKNNIAQNCTDGYYGTFDSSSDYNISDVDVSDAPNATFTNDYVNVTFADEANEDFHLGIGDTAARNSGADLSADSYLPITTDIDGHTRPTGTNVVDIGADEGATGIFYSVGQSTSTDFKVASNVTVNGYTATFTTAQTGNIGVGDIVTYTGGSCYITGKTSTSVWNCQNATGGTAPQVSGVSVSSIKRAFASLNSSISGSTAPTFLNTSDLKTNNYILNIPCYMDSGTTPDTTAVTISSRSYTTAVPNYLRIYTPNNTSTEANQSQRHQGKWDDTKYNIAASAGGGSGGEIIDIRIGNVKIDGLQINNNPSSATNNSRGIGSDSSSWVTPNLYITNNIIKLTTQATGNTGIVFSSTSGPMYISNNIVHDFSSSGHKGISVDGWTSTAYLYNNSINNCYTGFYQANKTVIAKNNIAQNTPGGGDGYSGTFTSSDYNISDQASDAPSASYRNNLATTVSFQDSANKDFHLGIGDTAARNQGINIGTGSTEPYLSFTTDIDGNTRNVDSKGWDIGADEAATAIYYSVGQSSSDLKSGSPTLSIDSSGNGTLSVSQTGNMGVGDYIEYGTSPYAKAYITGKTSSTVWTVQSATGSSLGVATTEPVNSIKHAYTSLNGAIAGASGSTMMNTTDLYTNNLQLSVPCYMDSGTADTTAVTISGYTTALTNYVRIYTPMGANESNNSQRHSGKWDEGKYKLVITGGYTGVLDVQVNNTYIDGLQIKRDTPAGSYVSDIYGGSATSNIRVSNNILTGVFGGTTDNSRAIYLLPNNSYIWNNIIYGFRNGSYANMAGILFNNGITCYVYNNTIYNNYIGISGGSIVIAKNNLSYNNTYDYSGSFDASSTNNISKDATSPNTALRNKTVNFVDSANYDFHLAEADTAARNSGADLSTDAINRVPTDIDGNSRPTLGAYDIGADEGSTYIYYSVGQNTSDHKTGSPTITLSGYQATLSVGQTAPNMGVGDKITYTGGSCYITAKTNDDKMHWNCQSATGGTAVQVSSVSVTSIAHAFNSLGGNTDSGALSANSGQGAKNSSHLNTSDLYSGNYVLNVPCYYDSGADASAVSVQNWTTAANNYIKVYTPTNTSTEANSSQRHSGKWDTSKYYISTTNAGIYIYENYFWIDGIQLKVFGNDSGWPVMVEINGLSPYDNKIKISNNILQADYSGMVTYGGNAISTSWGNQNVLNIWNNIIYDSIASTHFSGLYITGGKNYVYNNTIHNVGGSCMYNGSGTPFYAKNNITQNCGTDYAGGGYDASSDYNVSDGSGAPGTHSKNSTTVTFADAANDDFHLSQNDTAAFGAGTDLSSDSYLPFSTDIDGETRTKWCIGADDFVENAYKFRGNLKTRGNVKMH